MNPGENLALAIVYVAILNLNILGRDLKKHSAHFFRKLVRSIIFFGFINPVLIDQHRNVIVGRTRVRAAAKAGLTHVPTICIDHLSPEQLRAYRIAEQRLGEESEWDQDALAPEIQHFFSIPDFDTALLGFEIPEIDVVLGNFQDSEDQDDLLDLSSNQLAISVLGSRWRLRKHSLLCGDARNSNSFQILLEDTRASIVFVDSPYNVAIDGNAANIGGKGRTQYREFAMASGELSRSQFTHFLLSVCKHLATYSKEGAVLYVCMDWRHINELLEAGREANLQLLNLCVWVKNVGGMGSFYRSQHELVFVFKNGKVRNRNNIQLGRFGRNRTNVWNYPSANTLSKTSEEGNLLALHPTVKPVSLIADALLDTSARGDIVLDPFLGSGSTLIAAERTGRICYGIELDPLYIDVAIRRWQRYTGDQAVDSVTGRSFDEIAVEKTKETQNV